MIDIERCWRLAYGGMDRPENTGIRVSGYLTGLDEERLYPKLGT